MNVCFDVNTIIYLYTDSPKRADCFFAYDVVNLRRFNAYVPACALADMHYIRHRNGLAGKGLKDAMEALFEMFDVFDATGLDGKRALESPMKDFEDALIAQSAARNGMDVIITSNLKDFAASPVQAMSPAQFVEAFKPSNVDYGEVDLA